MKTKIPVKQNQCRPSLFQTCLATDVDECLAKRRR